MPHWMHPDDEPGQLATMGDAHAEWHRNAGVPMGQPGCPQDACHADYFDEEYEEQLAAEERAGWAALAPALRPGEEPAPLVQYLIRPDHFDNPNDVPW